VDVVVVGSVHRDLVLEVPHHPAEGETVLALSASHVGGGKGANQAVAAARLASSVALIGRVGNDPDGQAVHHALTAEGIDLQHLIVDDAAPTGTAVVAVDQTGENRIMVAPGASGRLAPDDVAAAAATIRSARVVALQQEIPEDTVLAAARTADGVVQLDPAPARPVSEDLLQAVGLLIPNQLELQQLVPGSDELATRAEQLRSRLGRPPGAVIVTLGADGALLVDHRGHRRVPAPRVTVKDTTAAGDAFRGAIAAELARGASLDAATAVAVRAGAAAASRLGAQPSLPRPDQLPTDA
jgi:ribokinase